MAKPLRMIIDSHSERPWLDVDLRYAFVDIIAFVWKSAAE